MYAHPYAAKTTSSAVLSRSSSSPHAAQHTRHHYVPAHAPPPPHRTRSPLGSIRGASVSVDSIPLLHDLPPSPAVTLHRSNSVSDASAERYRDLARMRMRRRGKVRGLVETWERTSASGSDCSAEEDGSVGTSDAESESDTDPDRRPTSHAGPSPQSPHDLPPIADSAPPPYAPHETVQDADDEPTIEELLASAPGIPLTGARAWEADFGLGETVKRVPAGANPDLAGASTSPRFRDKTQQPTNDSIRSSRSGLRIGTGSGSRRKNATTQKRVVTALFTGHMANVSLNTVSPAGDDNERAPSMKASSALQDHDRADSDDGLRALEESIATTRAQINAFRVRLEELEADTARQEAMLIQAQPSGISPHTSLRRRHSDATEKSMAETADQPRDPFEAWSTISLTDIARAIVAKAMRWVFPYAHVGPHSPSADRNDRPHHLVGDGKTRSGPGSSAKAKGDGSLSLARTSCSIVLISFALCAAVLRKVGFGRWARRP